MKELIFRERIEGLMIDEQERSGGYSMPKKHMHKEYELYVLLEGEQYYFIEEKVYHIKAGDIVLIGKEKIHWTSISNCPLQRRIMLSISEAYMDPFLINMGLWRLEQLFMECLCLHPDKERFDKIVRNLMDIRTELEGREVGYEAVVRMKLSEILLYLFRNSMKGASPRESNAASEKVQLVERAIAYIQENCIRKLIIQEIADKLFISRCYLTRIFKEVTGVTVNEYISIQRIQIGKKLLNRGEHSVTRISEMAGFESVTYFERVFRKYTGKTPKGYQKRVRI